MKRFSAEDWIEKLNLIPHPEGGYYKEVYRSADPIKGFNGTNRSILTSIYFLLRKGDVSHLHRIASDEMWYHHDGGRLLIHVFDESNRHQTYHLGKQIDQGDLPFHWVPKGYLFGSELDETADFALVSCAVAPGFDFDDFEMPTYTELTSKMPDHLAILDRLAFRG